MRTVIVNNVMLATLNVLACTAGKPNIVLALTDDLGWNYPGYHGTPSDTITPTLDQLAMQEGVRLGALSKPRAQSFTAPR